MSDAPVRGTPETEPAEALFDDYVDAALRGDVQDPAEFCARHGLEESELEHWLGALAGMLDAPAAEPTPGDDLPVERLGEYRLLRRLGEGGMGVVYLAEQTSLGRLVAVKLLRPELVGSASAAVRFRREATAIAKLRHPGIVSIIAIGMERNVSYLVMELVPGRSLDETYAEAAEAGEKLPVRRIVRWGAEIADALDAAHRSGVMHRDVKPSNIRVTPAGSATLIDFGLAKTVESEAPSITGPFAGSPAYASPEQIDTKARDIDVRTDVYSLGATLYEGLAGRVPFEGDTVERVFHSVLVSEPTPLRRIDPSIARDLEVVIAKAMEKDRERRYRTAREFGDDLRAVLELRPITARPAGPLLRALKWTRRNRAASTALLAATVAACLVAWMKVDQGLRERQRSTELRRAASRQAGSLLGRAMADLEAFDADVERAVEATNVANGFWRAQQWSFLEPQDRRRQQQAELYRARHLLERERVYGEVMQRVTQAQELDASLDVSDVLAYMYRQRCYEAVSLQQWRLARLYRDRLNHADRNHRFTADVETGGVLTVGVDRRDEVEVHLFRYESIEDPSRENEPRLMAVPLRGPVPEVPPGEHVLRVTRPCGTLAGSDLVIEVAGHRVSDCVLVRHVNGEVERLVDVDGVAIHDVDAAVRLGADGAPRTFRFLGPRGETTLVAPSLARLGVEPTSPRAIAQGGGVSLRAWTNGAIRTLPAPAGLDLRDTASPCPLGESSRLDLSTEREHRLDFGRYLAIVQQAGREDQRVSFQVTFGTRIDLHPRLRECNTSPAGMVYVPCDAQFRDHPGFWIMEHEVTSAEYLEFLNDAETRAEIDAATATIRVPRDASGQPFWSTQANGAYGLPADWHPDTPAMGVSWEDAGAFLGWKRRTSRDVPDGYEWSLPNFHEWIQAGTGGGELVYVHGDTFRPAWIKSRFTRPEVAREPVLSFPLDESPFCVFDMMGSAAEWLETPAFAGHDRDRSIAGGSWLDAAPDTFRLDGHRGAPPDGTHPSYGFRLVLVPKEKRR